MIDPGLCDYLSRRKVPFVLIGAVALAVHGVARFTADVDLLTLDPSVLRESFWTDYSGPKPEIRVGDLDDPLAGVVRFPLTPQHDLVIGRSAGAKLALAEASTFDGVPCPVASSIALLALKAEAGSPQDAHDARALLEAQSQLGFPELAAQFRVLLPSLDQDANAFVERFRLLEGLK